MAQILAKYAHRHLFPPLQHFNPQLGHELVIRCGHCCRGFKEGEHYKRHAQEWVYLPRNWAQSRGGATTGPDATHPPTIFQNLGGGVQLGVGGGVFQPGVGGGLAGGQGGVQPGLGGGDMYLL